MNNIKKMRLAVGLSQSKLAEKSGVSIKTIQNWESERRTPRDVYELYKLSVALGCAIEDLIEFEEGDWL